MAVFLVLGEQGCVVFNSLSDLMSWASSKTVQGIYYAKLTQGGVGGLVLRNTPSSNSANDIVETGCYYSTNWASGSTPIQEGCVIQIKAYVSGESYDGLQIFFSYGNGTLYYRIHWWNEWKPWHTISQS